MTNPIEWETGTPEPSTWYIVATTYPNNMAGGVIQCATWDFDHGWSVADCDTVIAHIPLKKVLKASDITWPEHLTS